MRSSDITATQCDYCGCDGWTGQSGGDIHTYSDGRRKVECCVDCVSPDSWAPFRLTAEEIDDDLTPARLDQLMRQINERRLADGRPALHFHPELHIAVE